MAAARVRKAVASRLADLLQHDPEGLAKLTELGLVSREWLERPGHGPMSHATLTQVLERFLQGEAEQHPSRLAALGLSTIQILSGPGRHRPGAGRPACRTVVFTDLENFTAFTARSGDDAARHVLDEHHRAVGPVVRRHDGRVVKHIGDGTLLTFPRPADAVLAARALVDEHPGPLELRAGAHTGEVLVLRDHDVIGHVVNVAARVTEVARGGEVLVTEQVRTAAGTLEGVRFSRLRRCSLRGLDETVRVCRARPALASP